MSLNEAIHWLRMLVALERCWKVLPVEIIAHIETSSDRQLQNDPVATIRLAEHAVALAAEAI